MVSPSRLTSKFGAVYSDKSLIVTALPPVVTGSMVTVPSPSAMLLPNAEIETLSVPAMVSVTVFPTATAVAMPVKSAPPSPSVALLAIASFVRPQFPGYYQHSQGYCQFQFPYQELKCPHCLQHHQTQTLNDSYHLH